MDLGKIIGGVLSSSGGQQQSGINLGGLVGSLLGGGQSSGGGGNMLGGIVGTLMQQGLGDQVKSWLSPDAKNQPVTAEQIQQALPQDQIQQAAQAAGVTNEEAAALISKVLPTIVDKVSPNGELQVNEQNVQKAAQGLDVGSILSGLGGLLGKK